MKNDCIFCAIAAGEIPSEILYQDDFVFVIADIAPQASAHYLMIPKVHKADLSQFTPQEARMLGESLLRYDAFARERGLTQGYRLVVNCGAHGRQSVGHLHVHLLGGEPLNEKMC